MSEESPPPLRLKPRLRPAGEETAADANPPPTPAPPAAEPEGAAPRLRLKPKLAAEPEPQPAAAAPAEPAAAPPPAPAPEKPRLKPRLSVEPAEPAKTEEPAAPAEPPPPAAEEAPPPPPAPPAPAAEAAAPAAEEAPKFKLKPKTAGAAPAAAAAPAPVAAPAAPPPVAPPAPAPGAAVPPPVPVKRPPPPAQALKKKLQVLGGVAAVLLVGGGLYFGWQLYGPKPAPPPAPAPKTTAGNPPPAVTPSETLNQIAAAPGALIGKAQDAITARRDREQERIDAAATGEDVPERRFLDTPLPGELGAKPAEPQVTATEEQIAPGVRATTWASSAQVTSTTQASQEFRNFVAGLTVSGVFWGTPARALINGRTYRAGDTIDQAQGIVFVEADNEAKVLVFRDRTGAIVTRK